MDEVENRISMMTGCHHRGKQIRVVVEVCDKAVMDFDGSSAAVHRRPMEGKLQRMWPWNPGRGGGTMFGTTLTDWVHVGMLQTACGWEHLQNNWQQCSGSQT